MPKKRSKKDKDFQKVKFKVGKKLPRAENVTSTAFKTKAIVIREQLKETSSDDLRRDILKKSKNPQELLAHLQHYNASFRLNSLNTIKAIMISDCSKLTLYLGTVVDRVSALALDVERDIRNAALECLSSVFNSLTVRTVTAFIPTITAQLRCAMTHLSEDVKLDSLKFLELLVLKYPQVLNSEVFKLTQNLLDLISTRSSNGKRLLKVTPSSKLSTVKWRQQAFAHLERLLSIRGSSTSPDDDRLRTSADLSRPSSLGGKMHSVISDRMYLATSGREEIVIRHHSVGKVAEESETALLQNFIVELTPLLRETWVELVSSAGHLGGEACATLLSVTNIIDQLYHIVRMSEIKNPQPVYQLLLNEVSHYITNRFPLSSSGTDGSKRKRYSAVSTSSSFPSSTLINLTLSSLASLLGCDTPTTRDYVLHLLNTEYVDDLDDYLVSFLHSVAAGDIVETLLVHLIRRPHISESGMLVLVGALEKLLTRRGSCRLDKKTEETIVSLACRPKLSFQHRLALLSVVNKACFLKNFNLDSQYNSLLEVTVKEIEARGAERSDTQSEEDTQMLRVLFALLNHVSAITSQTLSALAALLQAPKVVQSDTFDLLLQILYFRTQNGGLLIEVYISFVATLLKGYVALETRKDYMTHFLSNASTVVKHISHSFPNSEQIFNLLEDFYNDVMTQTDSGLLFSTCTALLGTAHMAKGCFSSDFLSDVTVCYLTHLSQAVHIAPHESTSEHEARGDWLYDNYAGDELSRVKSIPEVHYKTLKKLSALARDSASVSLSMYRLMVGWTVSSGWSEGLSTDIEDELRQALGVEDLEELRAQKTKLNER